MIYLGSHVGLKAPHYFKGSIEEALSYGANACMIYTGAPQNSKRKPIEELCIQEGIDLLTKNGWKPEQVIVHAPYIINLANTVNPEVAQFGAEFLQEELRRTHAIGAKILVLHPGAHLKAGVEAGIESIVSCLNTVLSQDSSDVKIALETMAGKGTEIGSTFEEIATIIERCEYSDRLMVCFDTCHVHDSGQDLNQLEAVLDHFDQVIGLDKIAVIHVNDSKNPLGAHKDRHENIGQGYIGFEVLKQIVHHPQLAHVVKILETPYIEKQAPYAEEIQRLKGN